MNPTGTETESRAEPRGATAHVELPVVGMTCVNCSRAVERALRKKLPGVREVQVSLATESAAIHYDPARVSLGAMAEAVGRAGFELVLPRLGEAPADAEQRARERELGRQHRRLWVGALFTLPLFALSMGRDFELWGPWAHAPWVNLLMLLLALPVQLYAAAGYYQGAWHSLRAASANMDVLVALGSSTAFAYSVAVTFVPSIGHHVYFETAASIVTLVLVGKLLEARARARASQAVRALLELAPAVAHLVERSGAERDIAVERVLPGDVVHVREAERIPVDGVVVAGASAVDESMLSGESIPVDKAVGDAVFGGTANRQGSIKVKATNVGAESALGQIVALVRRAQTSRAPIQRLADRVSAVFVPAIILVALTTFTVWLLVGAELGTAIVRTVAVLVIACPCAMGLATPTAIMVGSGRAARLGILFASAEAIETAGSVRLVLLDKTGTLTTGKPEIAAIDAAQSWDAQTVLSLAASAERGSSHPLAQALVAGASERGLPLLEAESFEARAGFGVDARVNGRRVQVGSPDWVLGGEEAGPEPTDATSPPACPLAELHEAVGRARAAGQSAIVVAIDGVPAAVIAVADRPRPGAAEAVRAMRELGLEPVMLTGDSEQAARAVAARVGIDRVIAGVQPDGKERAVRAARARGDRVAMVGDGVNDAPALAAADVGIAIDAGTDVAKQASAITLVGGDLRGVARAVALSRATMRTVRQNLFWAFFYNVALVPLAAGVLHPLGSLPGFVRDLHPAAAAAAMALSSITVVLNSLRLGRARLRVT